MLIDLTQNTVRRPSRACLFENTTSTETTISRTNGMEKRKEVSKKRQKEMRITEDRIGDALHFRRKYVAHALCAVCL